MVVRIILIVLIHAVIDGGWFVVGILIIGLLTSVINIFLSLQNFHEDCLIDNWLFRNGCYLSVGWVVATCSSSLACINALILGICVHHLFPMIPHMVNHVKVAWRLSNEYYNTTYLRNRGGFIKVCSVVRVQVFFLQLRAEGAANVATNGGNGATFANGATKGAIGFQGAAPIPAEVENSDKEEQDWD